MIRRCLESLEIGESHSLSLKGKSAYVRTIKNFYIQNPKPFGSLWGWVPPEQKGGPVAEKRVPPPILLVSIADDTRYRKHLQYA